MRRKDIDLDAGLIHVTKTWDFDENCEKPAPKTEAGARPVPIEGEQILILKHLCKGLQPNDFVLSSFPPRTDWACTLRMHLKRAGLTRAAIFEDTETVKHVTFYDLRACGITWRTWRGDDPRHITAAAGHEDQDTTAIYVREAIVYQGRVGTPFPPFPEVFRSRFLITTADLSRSGGISA